MCCVYEWMVYKGDPLSNRNKLSFSNLRPSNPRDLSGQKSVRLMDAGPFFKKKKTKEEKRKVCSMVATLPGEPWNTWNFFYTWKTQSLGKYTWKYLEKYFLVEKKLAASHKTTFVTVNLFYLYGYLDRNYNLLCTTVVNCYIFMWHCTLVIL